VVLLTVARGSADVRPGVSRRAAVAVARWCRRHAGWNASHWAAIRAADSEPRCRASRRRCSRRNSRAIRPQRFGFE